MKALSVRGNEAQCHVISAQPCLVGCGPQLHCRRIPREIFVTQKNQTCPKALMETVFAAEESLPTMSMPRTGWWRHCADAVHVATFKSSRTRGNLRTAMQHPLFKLKGIQFSVDKCEHVREKKYTAKHSNLKGVENQRGMRGCSAVSKDSISCLGAWL